MRYGLRCRRVFLEDGIDRPLHQLRQRRVDVNTGIDFRHMTLAGHGIDGFLNQDGGVGADNMETEDFASLFLKDGFGKTLLFHDGLAVGGIEVSGKADFDVMVFAGLLRGQPYSGDLGIGKDGMGRCTKIHPRFASMQ